MTVLQFERTIHEAPQGFNSLDPNLAGSLQLVEQSIERGIVTKGVYDPVSFLSAEDGLYFCPDKNQNTELPQVTGFEFLASGFELGAADSHHGVVFGTAAVTISNGIAETIRVAIKPFDTSSRVAEHERNCLLAAQRMGFDTYDPLALAKDGDTTYLITRFRDDVMSMDNEPWSVSPSDSERYERDVVPALLFAVDSLAQMHAKGLFHGDALAKNTVKTDTGNFVVMDLEDATIAEDEESHVRLINGDDFEEGKAFMDLTHYWYGLTHPVLGSGQQVFLEDEPYEVCMQEFELRYLNPYFDALARHTEPQLFAQFDIKRICQAVFKYAATH